LKILYLTFESRVKDPIIESQVVSLIEEITKTNDNDFTLISFGISSFVKKNNRLVNYEKINRGFALNTIYLFFYLLKNANKFDIIHVRSYLPMIAVIYCKLFRKMKIIFDPRGVYPEEIFYLFKKKNIAYYIFAWNERFFCKFSDAIIVVSQKFKDFYLKKYNLNERKIFVIPTFCQELSVFNNKENILEINLKRDFFHNESSMIFGFSGSYGNWQLTDFVFDFFNLVQDNIENAVFVIFSKEEEAFKQKFMSMNFSKECFFVKSLNKLEMRRYMKQIDYGILFRDNDVVNQVAAPIKVKDYLSSGVPIIMTPNIGDDSQFIVDYKIGYIIEDLTPTSMLKVINEIKNKKLQIDKDKLINLSQQVFGVKVVANHTQDVYSFIK